MANIHIPATIFYDHTPFEIHCALQAYYENKQLDFQNQWEQVRTQVYFAYMFTPTKNKVSYETFKRDYLPLNFDEKVEVEIFDDDQFAYLDNFILEKLGQN